VLVSQRVKTKVVMTALNAADPQSHSDQATTRRRSIRGLVGTVVMITSPVTRAAYETATTTR
jgi:hypothetical protein